MCAVSAVSDSWREQWPTPVVPLKPYDPFKIDPSIFKIEPLTPASPIVDSNFRFISGAEWAEYQALKAKAVAYDIATNQPDCVKPDVDAWEQDIEAFLILMGWMTEDGDVRAA